MGSKPTTGKVSMATTNEEVETDELERLAEMYGNNIKKLIDEKLPDAVADIANCRSFRNMLRLVSIARQIEQAVCTRISFRVHSASWREKHPEDGAAHDVD
jgi:hypothetical protein